MLIVELTQITKTGRKGPHFKSKFYHFYSQDLGEKFFEFRSRPAVVAPAPAAAAAMTTTTSAGLISCHTYSLFTHNKRLETKLPSVAHFIMQLGIEYADRIVLNCRNCLNLGLKSRSLGVTRFISFGIDSYTWVKVK